MPYPPKPLFLAVVSCLFAAPLTANPLGPEVVHGQASFQNQGSTLKITNSDGAIIHWQRFSIAPNETTRFQQPSRDSAVLNRVQGGDPSQLLGTLSSNGKVLLINPAGVLVGRGAKIEVGAFVASTLNLSDANFRAGKAHFDATPGAGKVENQGRITTPEGGQVYLVGAEVHNAGKIQAPQGQVVLAAGDSVRIEDSATPGVTVEITGTHNQATNLGQIVAHSGEVGVVGALVKNAGVINANQAVQDSSGRIFLKASQGLTVEAGSRISADAKTGAAGSVTLDSTAGDVTVAAGARISANGASGGTVTVVAATGTAHLAGDLEAKGRTGEGGTITAHARHIEQSGTLAVDGKTSGGTVTLKADTSITQTGLITANGARKQGGRVELASQTGAATAPSQTLIGGQIRAEGKRGGHIQITGDQVGVIGNARLDASGTRGGGKILVGGDYQGQNAQVPKAHASYVAPAARLTADAKTKGQGGMVVVWSEQSSRVHGRISARGGAQGGNGGVVETSGHFLDATTPADVAAPKGQSGTWLLDPNNITIKNVAGNTHISGAPDFTSTDDDAVIATSVIETALNDGTNVHIQTGSGGNNSQAGDITVIDPIAKTLGGNATLSLEAHNDIRLDAAITSTSGRLDIALKPDSDRDGGGRNHIAAVVDTHGGTFSLYGATGLIGGTLRNSEIALGAGGSLSVPDNHSATFDGVTLHGGLDMGTGTHLTTLGTTIIDGGLVTPGTVNINSGRLDLNGGGTYGGGLQIANGAVLNFGGGTHSLGPDAALDNAGELSISNGTVALQGRYSGLGKLTISGGVLDAQPNIVVGGDFTWTGGELQGAGLFTTTGTSTLDSASSGALWLNNKTWINQGHLTLSGSSQLYLRDGNGTDAPALVNAPSGVIDMNSDNQYPFFGYDFSALDNQGTLNWNQTHSQGFSQLFVDIFNNSGTVNLHRSLFLDYADGQDSGRYTIDNGQTLTFYNTVRDWNPGISFAGSGTMVIANATLTTKTPLTLARDGGPSLEITAGTLSAPFDLNIGSGLKMTGGVIDASGQLDITGPFTWTGGTLQGAGPLITHAASTVDGAVILQEKTWTNQGTLTLAANAHLALNGPDSSAATLDNQGVIEMNSPHGLVGSQGVFNNTGTLNWNAAATIQMVGSFNNRGQVNVNQDLTVLGVGGLDEGGIYHLAADRVLSFETQTRTWNAVQVTGPGTLKLANSSLGWTHIGPAAVENLTLAGYTTLDAAMDLTVTRNFIWNGNNAILKGAGEFITSGTSQLNGVLDNALFLVDKTWRNRGTLTLSGTAPLILDHTGPDPAPTLINESGGVIDMASSGGIGATVDGRVENAGILHWRTAATLNVSDFELQPGAKVVIHDNLTIRGAQGSDQGQYDYAVPGKKLVFDNAVRDWKSGVAFTGTGDLVVDNSTIHTDTPLVFDASTPKLTLSGYTTLDAAADLTLHNDFVWNGIISSLSGAGLFTTTGHSQLSGTDSLFLVDKSWHNRGVIDFTGTAPLLLDYSDPTRTSSFENQAGGIFNMASTGGVHGAVNRLGPGGVSQFSNAGTLNWNAVAELGLESFANSGTVQVAANMDLQAPGVDTGSYRIAGGHTLTFGQARTFQGLLELLAADAVFDTSDQNFTNQGTFTGVGIVNLGGGTLLNQGLIAPGAVPGLQINGNFIQDAKGRLAVGLVDTTQHDVLAITGSAQLDGGLEVTGAAPEGRYTVLTTQRGVTGQFATLDTQITGIGTEYAAESVNLVSTPPAPNPNPEPKPEPPPIPPEKPNRPTVSTPPETPLPELNRQAVVVATRAPFSPGDPLFRHGRAGGPLSTAPAKPTVNGEQPTLTDPNGGAGGAPGEFGGRPGTAADSTPLQSCR